MKLIKIHTIEAKLELETGLHIGSGDVEMHIGGIDNGVIKDPVSGLPYIPGSSLKGKIRSLLEWRTGAVKESPLGKKEYEQAASIPNQQKAILSILQLFGIGGDMGSDSQFIEKVGPTRISFWDCFLNSSYIEESKVDKFTEAKMENRINRISGTAEHPRQTERVVAGAKFDFKLTFKEFEGDDGEALFKAILDGLKLLEWDSLGGSGSRGYGKVKFVELTHNKKEIQKDFADIQPFSV